MFWRLNNSTLLKHAKSFLFKGTWEGNNGVTPSWLLSIVSLIWIWIFPCVTHYGCVIHYIIVKGVEHESIFLSNSRAKCIFHSIMIISFLWRYRCHFLVKERQSWSSFCKVVSWTKGRHKLCFVRQKEEYQSTELLSQNWRCVLLCKVGYADIECIYRFASFFLSVIWVELSPLFFELRSNSCNLLCLNKDILRVRSPWRRKWNQKNCLFSLRWSSFTCLPCKEGVKDVQTDNREETRESRETSIFLSLQKEIRRRETSFIFRTSSSDSCSYSYPLMSLGIPTCIYSEWTSQCETREEIVSDDGRRRGYTRNRRRWSLCLNSMTSK